MINLCVIINIYIHFTIYIYYKHHNKLLQLFLFKQLYVFEEKERGKENSLSSLYNTYYVSCRSFFFVDLSEFLSGVIAPQPEELLSEYFAQ